MRFLKKQFISGFVLGIFFTVVLEFVVVLWVGKVYRPNQLQEALSAPPIKTENSTEKLYEFKVHSVNTNESFVLSEIKSKVIFLNFWATWCQPCIAEFPSIESLKYKMKGKSVEFIIVSDESIEKVKKFDKRRKFDLPLYVTQDSIPSIYEGNSIPRTFIIADGEIIYEHEGMAKWDDQSVIDLINNNL